MTQMLKQSILTLLALLMFIPLNAQDSGDGFADTWEGTLTVPGASLQLIFHFTKSDDGSFGGTMDSPDQGATGIPLGAVTINESELIVAVPTLAGEYRATLNEGQLEGTWSQGGQSFPLNLQMRVEAEEEQVLPSRPDIDVTGTWMGRLNAGGTQLRVVFHIEEGENGTLAGTLDSPDQGATGIPLGEISGSGSSIMIQVPSVAGSYEGTIEADRSAIEGTWSQGGGALPLRLEPADDESIRLPDRPQEPRPPYPYIEEEVGFHNTHADIRLAGTLTIPDGDGPFPAAILISGSGPQNRDEALLGHSPFHVLADHMTRQGIAVLRYDDRGIAESTGDFAAATSVDFAADASAAVDFLKGRSKIDPERIGLVGHSEGGLIAPIVAVDRSDLGYIVLMAGPGVTGAEILYEQGALIARAAGADEERIAENVASQRAMFEIVMSDVPLEEARRRLREYFSQRLAEMDEQEREESGFSEAMIESQVQQVASPWMRYFLSYDPRPTLEKVTCPTLVINGEKDLQVPPYQNLPEIERALKKAGNLNFRIVEMEGLNHLFQTSETGAPSEYATIEETFSPKAMQVIANWILKDAS
jgi:pimeloyl-ACP methyl ester carboxylesterase